MNRIFHARTPKYTWLWLAVTTALTVWALWNKQVGIGVFAMAMLVVIIERTINTTYTITTDKSLIIDRGRFARKQEIAISEIRNIERVRSMNFLRWHLKEYILIEATIGGKEVAVSLMPRNEELFLELMNKQRQA